MTISLSIPMNDTKWFLSLFHLPTYHRSIHPISAPNQPRRELRYLRFLITFSDFCQKQGLATNRMISIPLVFFEHECRSAGMSLEGCRSLTGTRGLIWIFLRSLRYISFGDCFWRRGGGEFSQAADNKSRGITPL